MLAGIAPSVMALDVTDSDVKMTVGVQLQFWAQASKGTDDTEAFNRITGAETTATPVTQPYDATNGVNNQYPAPVDFFLRRARFSFKGTYKSVWIYSVALRIDNQDKGVNGANRTPAMHNAYLGRKFKMNDDWTSQVKAGLDYAFFCPADSGPSANLLLPAQRATQGMVAVRGVGVAYKLSGPFLTWGVDVQNNTAENSGVAGQQTKSPGLWYSTRVEFSPKGDWHVDKYQESFAGAEGKGVLVGAEVGENKRALVANVSETATGDLNGNGTVQTFTAGAGGVNYVAKDTLCYGAEALVHVDGLSALAEARWQKDKYTVDSGTAAAHSQLSGNQKGFIWLAQAGYAIKVNGGTQALELALRYTSIDKNTEFDHETAGYGAGDFGVSGQQEEAGLNWYFAGHNSKMGLMYTHWTAEQGNAHENIVRLTEQLTF
jgi:hypothetical protein